MALKHSNKRKDKEVWNDKTEKQKAHWTMSNDKLFIDFANEHSELGWDASNIPN